MDAKFAAIVLLVALFSGGCTANVNIFNVEYKDQLNFAVQRAKMSEGDWLQLDLVADYLARSYDKDTLLVAPGVTIRDLLWLAEFDLHSAKDCSEARLDKSTAICDKFSASHLETFCRYCLDKLTNHCASQNGNGNPIKAIEEQLFNEHTNEEDNLFDVDYDNDLSFDEICSYLDDMDNTFKPKDFAELLARSEDKGREVAADITINHLLKLAEYDRDSTRDCRRERVNKSEELCKRLEGYWYDYWADYCEYCLKELKDHCSDLGVDPLVD